MTAHDLLAFALSKYADRVDIRPPTIIKAARQSKKRPAVWLTAVPDDWVKNVKGAQDQVDVYMLVRVPRELIDRAESRIVLP